MCGIVGYTGDKQASPILLDGLEKLEYRGYDSAGIAVENGGKLTVSKTKGRLALLREKTENGAAVQGMTGIGHTRWATHGKPSEENSHPHVSESGRVAIVHNGIIENYMEIKQMLLNRGRSFVSETDTEVAAQLIDFYYEGDILQAVAKAVREFEGNYALGILCVDEPGKLIAVRNHAPLIVGYAPDGNYFASDVMALLAHTRSVTYLADGEIAVLEKTQVRYCSSFLDPIEKKIEHIDWELSAAEKGGYAHFMLKEIYEQPKAVRDTIHPRIRNGQVQLDDIHLPVRYLANLKRIYIVACGSAYYVGVHGKYIIENLCQVPVEPVLASEFRYADPVLDDTTLVVIISQSGETADTLAALREAKRRGARTLAVVNVVGSSIAKTADDVLYTWAGPEIAVATTKAFSTQLSVMYLKQR